MFLTNDTIQNLSQRLNLAYNGTQQDWDIEFANPDRLLEFIEFASKEDLTTEEAYGIMSLIIASYDDYLSAYGDYNPDVWKKIIDLLNKNPELYKDLLNYWAVWDENDDLYFITKLVRSYLQKA